MKDNKYKVWWFEDKISSVITAEEVEELKNTARYGFKEIDTFSTKQIISEDWIILIEEKIID